MFQIGSKVVSDREKRGILRYINLISRREIYISPAEMYILPAEICISRREIKFSPYMYLFLSLKESLFFLDLTGFFPGWIFPVS